MKKRRADPPLTNIRSSRALRGIWSALEGDPKWLAERLRAGVASNAEQAVAADLIEGKVKPRRPRSERERRLEVAQTVSVMKRAFPKARPKAIMTEVINAFGGVKEISERHIYDVLAEFDDETLANRGHAGRLRRQRSVRSRHSCPSG